MTYLFFVVTYLLSSIALSFRYQAREKQLVMERYGVNGAFMVLTFMPLVNTMMVLAIVLHSSWKSMRS